MNRFSIIALCLLIGTGASASSALLDMNSLAVQTAQVIATSNTAFKVGDTDNYNLTIATFKGTMITTVTDLTPPNVTIDQKIILGSMGQEDAIEVINLQTGEVVSITVNGKSQTPPPKGDVQIISATAANITVPAGTFNCEDAKIHTKSTNSDSEEWIEVHGVVPVGGMLKMTTSTKGLPIVAELTSYSNGQ